MLVDFAKDPMLMLCCHLRPGYVLTDLTKTILDANTELRDTWLNMTPMVSAVVFIQGTVRSSFHSHHRVVW